MSSTDDLNDPPVVPLIPPVRGSNAYLTTTLAALTLPAAAVLTSPLLARALGADGRGAMAAIMAPVGFATLIATVGIAEALNYHISKDPDGANSTARRGLLIAVLYGVIATIILLLAAPVLTRNIPQYEVVYLVLSATLPWAMGNAAIRGVAQGLQLPHLVNRERYLAVALRVTALIVAFAFLRLDVLTAVYATWASGLISVIVYLPVIRALRSRPRSAGTAPKALACFGLKVWLGTLSGVLVLRLDQLVLTVVVAPASLGLYVIAAAVAEVPQTAVGALQQLVLSRTAQDDKNMTVFARTIRIAVLITSTAALIGIASAPVVVPAVFGAEFDGAVVITQILLVATVPSAVNGLLIGALIGINAAGAAARIQVFGFAVTFVTLLILIPRLGIEGAALSSLISYTATAVWACARFRLLTGVRIRQLLVPQRGDISLLLSSLPLGRRVQRARRRSRGESGPPSRSD